MPDNALLVIFTFGKTAFTHGKAIVNFEESKALQDLWTLPSAYIYGSLY
jgi:hypothetical protein